jgi:hypothetical protein
MLNVLMQQKTRDLLRDAEGKMQPEPRMLRDNPENRGDWLV